MSMAMKDEQFHKRVYDLFCQLYPEDAHMICLSMLNGRIQWVDSAMVTRHENKDLANRVSNNVIIIKKLIENQEGE